MADMHEWKWLKWVEPFNANCDPVYMCTSAKAAIAVQREKHSYESDRQALEDFIAIHWCTEADDPRQQHK